MNIFDNLPVQASRTTMKARATCLISLSLLAGPALGQELEEDPFNNKDWHMEQMLNKVPDSWEIMWEVFSLPFADAAKLQREQNDAGKVYQELVKRSESGKATLEEFLILTGKIGIKSSAESIEEMIFPTEYEPPELPNAVGNTFKAASTVNYVPITPATPTSFTTRKMGSDLRIEWEQKVTPEVIKVTLEFDRVELLSLSTWGQGKSTTQMPEFAVQGFQKSVLLKSGQPVLVGTMSPPKNRPEKKNEHQRVWFAFATATPSED